MVRYPYNVNLFLRGRSSKQWRELERQSGAAFELKVERAGSSRQARRRGSKISSRFCFFFTFAFHDSLIFFMLFVVISTDILVLVLFFVFVLSPLTLFILLSLLMLLWSPKLSWHYYFVLDLTVIVMALYVIIVSCVTVIVPRNISDVIISYHCLYHYCNSEYYHSLYLLSMNLFFISYFNISLIYIIFIYIISYYLQLSKVLLDRSVLLLISF